MEFYSHQEVPSLTSSCTACLAMSTLSNTCLPCSWSPPSDGSCLSTMDRLLRDTLFLSWWTKITGLKCLNYSNLMLTPSLSALFDCQSKFSSQYGGLKHLCPILSITHFLIYLSLVVIIVHVFKLFKLHVFKLILYQKDSRDEREKIRGRAGGVGPRDDLGPDFNWCHDH